LDLNYFLRCRRVWAKGIIDRVSIFLRGVFTAEGAEGEEEER